MKTLLQYFFSLCAALFIVGAVQAQTTPTVASTLNNATDVKNGVFKEFTVTMQPGGSTGTAVRGRFSVVPALASQVRLEYQDPQTQEFTPLTFNAEGVAFFGPEAGVALANNTTFTLRVSFEQAQAYAYQLGVVTAGANPTVLATASETVNVTQVQEPTINGTLDIIPDLRTNTVIESVIYFDANDREDDLVRVRIRLTNPAQRNNLSIQYWLNPVDGTPQNFQPLTIDENGVGVFFGGEDGVPLKTGRMVLRWNFTTTGTYNYTLDVQRVDGNILASVVENVEVLLVNSVNDKIENTKIEMYPTLVSDRFNINLGQVRNAQVTITDLLGRTVLQLNNVSGGAEINTAGFAKGTYLVKVLKGKETVVSRVIVQ